MTIDLATKSVSFALPKRKVLVKPIIRRGKWLPEGHSGNFLYDNSKIEISVPTSRETGYLIDPLSDDERAYFENKVLSGLGFGPGDLSVSKSDGNFWRDFSISVRKSDIKGSKDPSVIDDNSVFMTLDLSKPMDYIKYKVFLTNSSTNGLVAPSWETRLSSATYRLALVEENFVANEQSKVANDKIEAYMFFGSIHKEVAKIIQFLNVYWLTKNKNTHVPNNASREFLEAEINKIIDTDVKGFLAIARDKEYDYKIKVYDAIRLNVIRKSKNKYEWADGTHIADSLSDVVAYFRDKKNTDELLRLDARIETMINKKSE